MKLSEAILLGSIGSGQCRADFDDANGNTCALGAALRAIGKLDNVNGFSTVEQEWPWAAARIVKNPSDNRQVLRQARVVDMIWDLNDCAKWTRPQIAAWVATIEPAEDQAPAPVKHEHVPEPESVNII